MNILMLSDVYFPRVNGVSTSIRTFAQSLARSGHAVTLVVPDYGPGSGQELHDSDEFEIIRLQARVIFFDPEDRLIRAPELRRILPQLAQRHWDVIHIHTPFRAHRLGVQLAQASGRPTVETYHTYFEEYIGHYLPWAPAPLLRFVARRVSRTLCHGVDHLIVPTAQMVEVLDRYGVTTPSTVLPTGIDLAEFARGDGARFRAEHEIDARRPTIVTVSRLAVEKNIAFLLQVARRLIADFPELMFIIAGEGPDAERLKRLSKEYGLERNVRFFGNLDRRTSLLDAYRAGDAFVFASPTETQGLVLIEAMALGVPIVSTAVMGTATVLRGARSAVVSEENVEAFARHLGDVLRSPQRRAELSAAGPLDARAWSTEGLMEQVVALYQRLAQAKPALMTTTSTAATELSR
ncbi:glycosyltransferase [Lysobacter antibioticus]|uniref:glycosyltransferase n=1 Tax=Lysobacter antibioticus TaxID=84531 RepID=UPI000569AD10|nr:glycosyltransferase [Lysobacter antibioticus]